MEDEVLHQRTGAEECDAPKESFRQPKFHSVTIVGLIKYFRTLQNAGVYCRLPNPQYKNQKGFRRIYNDALQIPLHKKMLPK